MKNFLLILFFAGLVACGAKTHETQTADYIPELLIKDSLVIDHLTELSLIDVRKDHSEFLFFDFKTDEFLRVNQKGDVIFSANRKEDGQHSYQEDYFYTADYIGNDQILILTYSFGFFYDLEFNLLEKKKLDFKLETRNAGGSRAAEALEHNFYTFSFDENDVDEVYVQRKINLAYPFLTIRDLRSLEKIATASIPEESQIKKLQGNFINKEPILYENGEELLMLFPNSPEIYAFDKDSLLLKRSLQLNPEDTYKQTLPPNPEIPGDGHFKELAGSNFTDFSYSNAYLLVSYNGAAPKDEVDALPRNVIGGEEFMKLVNKYKQKRYYQIFKDEQKLWEGEWPILLRFKKGVLFSVNAKPDENPDAVEKDVQTIYFYELR